MADTYLNKKTKHLLAIVAKHEARTMDGEVFALLKERAKELGINLEQFEEAA